MIIQRARNEPHAHTTAHILYRCLFADGLLANLDLKTIGASHIYRKFQGEAMFDVSFAPREKRALPWHTLHIEE